MTTSAPTLSPVRPLNHKPSFDLLGWLSLAGRLLLAGVLGYAALTKIGDPAATVRAVRAYQLLPESVAVPFGHALPAFELAVAVLLLLGVAVRLTGGLAALLMDMFFLGIVSAAARGLKIDCGCFGGGGPTDDPKYALELLRDGALLAVAIGITILGRSRLALDPSPASPLPPSTAGSSATEQRRQRALIARQSAVQARVEQRLRMHRLVAVVLVVLASVLGMAVDGTAKASGELRVPTGVTSSGGVLVGSPTAKHQLVVFEDPQCPACARFEQVSGAVLTQAVAQGKVRVDYRMRSFLGPESVRAVAALGAAADEGRFAEMLETVFAHQPQEHSGGYTVADLLDLGAGVGLDSASFQEAVKTQKYARWAGVVDDRASRDGNVGTPELRLDGKVLDASVSFDPVRFAAALS